MITKDDVKEFAARIRQNNALLGACVGPHEFHRIEPDKVFSKWRCAKCGGIVPTADAQMYNLGLLHGRGQR
jgi:hypothetical protein